MSNLIRNYVKNTRIKKAKLEKELKTDIEIINNRKEVIDELKKTVNIADSDIQYHKSLRIFKDPKLNTKRDSDEIKKKYKNDESIINILNKYEKQVQEGIKVLNNVCLQLDKESQTNKNIHSKLEYYNEGISEFINSALSELNDVTIEYRKDQKIKSTPAPQKSKTKKEKEKEQKVPPTDLVEGTNIFRIFRNEKGDILKPHFKRKYED